MAIIRAALTVMVTLLHSPGRAIALSVTGRGSKAISKQPCRIQTLAIRSAAAAWTASFAGIRTDIVCNECGTVLRTVPAANVGQTPDRAGNHPRGCQRNVPALRVGKSVPGLFQNARIHLSAVRKGVLRPE
jgi:hypothetical protein